LLEGLSSKAAVSRSYTLVKKNWWWISGRMFVLGIIISLVNAILGRIPGIGEIIGSILSTPFLVIGHILIYYDLRLRKEGYSVETLSEELNIKSDLKITKVWEDLSNEASTFYEQGKFPEADRRLQEALKAAEFALGPEHLEVSKILRNLAELFEAQGKYTEAEPLYKRVLNIREKALGPDHPDVANICENMGKCYRNMGKKGEAAKLEVRARQIRSK
jgi:tetratricopeptide (TPR) repeat protein